MRKGQILEKYSFCFVVVVVNLFMILCVISWVFFPSTLLIFSY